MPPLKVCANTQAKVSRLHVVKPDFDVLYADVLVKLNGSNYLIYGVDSVGDVVIRIQDCSYKRDNASGEKFVPRCVKFTVQQWADLLSVGSEVTQAAGYDENTRVHIGGNTFVTIKTESGVIDIREYFLPQDSARCLDIRPEQFYDMVIPTKRGVRLTVHGWDTLVTLAANIIANFAGDKLHSKEACLSQHVTDVGILACGHCNPNGFTRWV